MPKEQTYYGKFCELVAKNPEYLEYSSSQLSPMIGSDDRTARRVKEQYLKSQLSERAYITDSPKLTADTVLDNKKVGKMDWREILSAAQGLQAVRKKASGSNKEADISIKTKYDKIIVLPLADTHLGSFGTDYDLFLQYIDLAKNCEPLYIGWNGDLVDYFVQFKTMKAVFSQVLNPEMQLMVLEGCVKEVAPKTLWATWCNHSQFEERVSGMNQVKNILKERLLYFDGIAKFRIHVNGITYSMVTTHKPPLWSRFNLTHGLKQMARLELPSCDLYMAGDKHQPAVETVFMQGKIMHYLQSGTLKTDDAFGHQYFAPVTCPAMPCFVLDATKKEITTFWTVQQAMIYCGLNPNDYVKKKKK